MLPTILAFHCTGHLNIVKGEIIREMQFVELDACVYIILMKHM